MCTYNGEKYLLDQLNSIQSQSVLPDELVICDDRSTDRTIEIIQNFKNLCPFQVSIYINKENLGSTKNFEKAIKLCVGDIIVLSDQDDVWHNNKLESICSKFYSSQNCSAVFTNADIVDENLSSLNALLWDTETFRKKDQNRFISGGAVDILLNHNIVTGATMAFKKEFVDFFVPIPENWVHDGWIALLIAIFGKIEVIDKPLIKYRQHSSQQLGAVETGIFKKTLNKISMFLEDSKQYATSAKATCLDDAERFKQVIKILSLSKHPHDEAVLLKLESKVEHLVTRGSLPFNRIQRVKIILNELIKKRYKKYSLGISSAIKDLLFV